MSMVAWTHDEFPQPPNGEHPIIAVIAVVAIVAAILLITWARFEVMGTSDIQSALTEGGPAEVPRASEQRDAQREVDAAVTTNRFATGVSPQ